MYLTGFWPTSSACLAISCPPDYPKTTFLYQQCLNIVPAFCILDCLIDSFDGISAAHFINQRMKVFIRDEEVQILFHVYHGILGRPDDVQRLECNGLWLNRDSAGSAVLAWNQIYAPVAENIHALPGLPPEGLPRPQSTDPHPIRCFLSAMRQ